MNSAQSLLDWIKTQVFPATGPTTATESTLSGLPPTIEAHLADKLRQLSLPLPYRATLEEEIATAITNWHEDPDAPNSLVVLSNPVEDITTLLTETLANWLPPSVTLLYPFESPLRPQDWTTIPAQLQHRLHPRSRPESPTGQPLLVVIPDLAHCFLRHIGGWEGVEWIRDTAASDRSRFWLIGCNHWTWQFLNSVCQIGAYFENIQTVPKLDGEAFQTWLSPLEKTVLSHSATAQSDATQAQATATDWDELATLAEGSAAIAAQLWLRSLRIPDTDIFSGDTSGYTPTTGLRQSSTLSLRFDQIPIQVSKPDLPNLPSIDADDRYLLNSLLIHSSLTLEHLALSLGDSHSVVQAKVQVLQRSGLLMVVQNHHLRIHPIHYLKLKAALNNNNFLVSED